MEDGCLAVMVPLMVRALRERSTVVNRRASVIIENMSKLVGAGPAARRAAGPPADGPTAQLGAAPGACASVQRLQPRGSVLAQQSILAGAEPWLPPVLCHNCRHSSPQR